MKRAPSLAPLFLAACLLFGARLIAAGPPIPPSKSTVMQIWPEDAASSFEVETVVHDNPDDPYAIKIRVARPSLVVYRPDPSRANHVAVLICPGGAYARLFLTRGGIDYALFLSEHGYDAALLKYRLPVPQETIGADPLPLQDVKRALRVLRARAADLGINPRWIGIVGTSAGGHVAASCAAFGDDGNADAPDPIARVSCRPDFVVLTSAVISMEPDIGHVGSRQNLLGSHPNAADIERFSIEKQVGPQWPPTLIVVARDDSISPENSFRLAAAIRRAGRPVESLTYDRGGHAFALFNLQPPLSEWPQKWLDWMAALTFSAKSRPAR